MGLVSACGPEKKVPNAPDDPMESQQNATPAPVTTQRNSSEEEELDFKGQYAGWGAHAGTTATLEELAKCNKSGYFFDRAAENGKGQCDKSQKILGNCNSFDSAKELAEMNEVQINDIENHLAKGGLLEGFLFDQCVDGGTTTYIWLVRQSEDGTIGIKRLSLDKPI